MLLKAIYGLDDAPLLWRKAIAEFLPSMGWVSSFFDRCFFYLREGAKAGKVVRKGRLIGCLTLHIDDEGVAGRDGVSAELKRAMVLRFGPVSVQLELWRHIGNEYEQVWLEDGTTRLTDPQEFYTKTISPIEVPKGAERRF